MTPLPMYKSEVWELAWMRWLVTLRVREHLEEVWELAWTRRLGTLRIQEHLEVSHSLCRT